ncbi:MAG: hypothetical protein JWM87_1121 [Candidatus Eremiobacteraeota bacterium]|nr:hypothetical protein [Candidatus Eremiobacteraeota bacterium]
MEQDGEKRAWYSPEIVDVGGVVETTTLGKGKNVRDNNHETPETYSEHGDRSALDAEVDLADR